MTIRPIDPNVSLLPGGGPWRIVQDCPGSIHNTAHAAREGGCRCPHALELRREEWRRQDQKRRKSSDRIGFPLTLVDASTPDLSKGHCVTGGRPAQAIMDGGYDAKRTVEGFAARERAKGVCWGSDGTQCPAMSACDGWVTGYEDPAGSWGGVFAGKDQWERAGLVVTLHPRLIGQMRKMLGQDQEQDQEKGA